MRSVNNQQVTKMGTNLNILKGLILKTDIFFCNPKYVLYRNCNTVYDCSKSSDMLEH